MMVIAAVCSQILTGCSSLASLSLLQHGAWPCVWCACAANDNDGVDDNDDFADAKPRRKGARGGSIGGRARSGGATSSHGGTSTYTYFTAIFRAELEATHKYDKKTFREVLSEAWKQNKAARAAEQAKESEFAAAYQAWLLTKESQRSGTRGGRGGDGGEEEDDEEEGAEVVSGGGGHGGDGGEEEDDEEEEDGGGSTVAAAVAQLLHTMTKSRRLWMKSSRSVTRCSRTSA